MNGGTVPRPPNVGERVGQALAPADPAEPSITNSEISELLAIEAESASQPLQRAFRRVPRKALPWTDETSQLYREQRSLTELPGIGPHLEKIILGWLQRPPLVSTPPDIRQNFLTWTEAHSILEKASSWSQSLKGDLQMHSLWSDGSGSIQEMAEAGDALGYEYIAITDHSKGLKIAGGINEDQLEQQAAEIQSVNDAFETAGRTIRVLRSVELNLTPAGEGDMTDESLRRLDLVLGCFHSALRKKDDQTGALHRSD
jgi:putative hydrolase